VREDATSYLKPSVGKRTEITANCMYVWVARVPHDVASYLRERA